MRLKPYIQIVPDFPKKGVPFLDIVPLLADPKAFRFVLDQMAKRWKPRGITAIAGLDARGFIFGGALAAQMSLPFVPIRKKGKLPGKTHAHSYDLEYGSATLEISAETRTWNARHSVLIVDDVLATGGTAAAAEKLLRLAKAEVAGYAFLIEIVGLRGREKLGDYPIQSIITYGENEL